MIFNLLMLMLSLLINSYPKLKFLGLAITNASSYFKDVQSHDLIVRFWTNCLKISNFNYIFFFILRSQGKRTNRNCWPRWRATRTATSIFKNRFIICLNCRVAWRNPVLVPYNLYWSSWCCISSRRACNWLPLAAFTIWYWKKPPHICQIMWALSWSIQ